MNWEHFKIYRRLGTNNITMRSPYKTKYNVFDLAILLVCFFGFLFSRIPVFQITKLTNAPINNMQVNNVPMLQLVT